MDNIGFLGLETAEDYFKRLTYDYDKLIKEENNYNYMDFILTSNHLLDWMDADSKYKHHVKDIKKSNIYCLLNDMANRNKHFIRKDKIDYKPFSNPASKDAFYPAVDFSDPDLRNGDFSKFNFGPDAYIVKYKDTEVDLLEECIKYYKLFQSIFENS